MEEIKSPSKYLVFRCTKCGRYLYCKESQKQKRCPVCRRMNEITLERETFIGKGAYIVNSLTEANKEVVRLQREYSMGKTQDFVSSKPSLVFKKASSIPSNPNPKGAQSKSCEEQPINLVSIALKKIIQWQNQEHIEPYVGFPKYMLDIILSDICQNLNDQAKLLNQIKSNGRLTRLKNDCYYASK